MIVELARKLRRTRRSSFRGFLRLVVATNRCLSVSICAFGLFTAGAASSNSRWSFDFCGTTPSRAGHIRVYATNAYSAQLGYGFDFGTAASFNSNGCFSDKPFFFSVAVPEGNYRVTAVLGSADHESTTTIKAESRRLMVENVHTRGGGITNCTFTVNVRTPKIDAERQVRLKPRELGPPLVLHWDDKLTIEFNGSHPSLRSLEITKVEDAITVYLAGDSTVTDQPREPWNSWGQMLPRFFTAEVAVANHAESGESMPSFLSARRLEKILSTIKPGDYLFIQFGHNDQKDKRAGAGAFTTYRTNLIRFIAETRQRGATPVLITPMERKSGVISDTLGDFPAAVREVARDENIPLIDLNQMSKTLYRALGEKLGEAFQDGTHHNNYGSYELARCVVEGIKSAHLPLAKFLADVTPFDPEHPDSIATFNIPASPMTSNDKPEGN